MKGWLRRAPTMLSGDISLHSGSAVPSLHSRAGVSTEPQRGDRSRLPVARPSDLDCRPTDDGREHGADLGRIVAANIGGAAVHTFFERTGFIGSNRHPLGTDRGWICVKGD